MRQQPKWKREGFTSYRQYLNARYKALGFTSYSDYTSKLKHGKVKSRKRTKVELEKRNLPPVSSGTQERISYESKCPIKYGFGQMVGDELVEWIDTVIHNIEAEHVRPDGVIPFWSGAWRLFGKIARELDDDGLPIWSHNEEEEWSSHQEWEKMIGELRSIVKAYGDWKFLNYGRRIGKGDSKLYGLIIKRVRISVILDVDSSKQDGSKPQPPEGAKWREGTKPKRKRKRTPTSKR